MVLRVKALTLIALCALAFVAAQAHAQSGRMRNPAGAAKGRDEQKEDKDAVRLRAEEVLLPVSIRSEKGELPVVGRNDFIVSEDGKRRQVSAVMRAQANVLLLIDAGGHANTGKDTNINREIAYRIVDSLGKDDRAAIITYSDKVSLLSGWTSDKDALRRALEWQYRPGIEARFYDSLLYAAEEVLPKADGRRSVVLLTDGVDSIANTSFERALAALHRARATVYVMSHAALLARELRPKVMHKLAWYEMIDPQVRKRYEPLRQYVRQLEAAEITLKGLAEETGGAIWNPETRPDCKPRKAMVFSTKDADNKLEDRLDCEAISNKIIEEIGTEYIVAYSSERPPNDEKFHAVRVFVTRPEIKVRTRRGVYSNQQPANL